MATKLYPPYLNGTIPAFYGTTLVVPFSMNKAVGRKEVTGFSLKIKTVGGNIVEIATYDCGENGFYGEEVPFSLTGNYTIGQYYKVQMAYISEGTIGYYSTVGVVKCTTKPTVTIQNLKAGKFNNHIYDYVGVYSQKDKDTTEKLYSSKFIFKDENHKVIMESDEILHITSNDDVSYEAIEGYTVPRDLEENKIYYLQYIATSSNGLKITSPNYKIVQYKSLDTYITNDFIAENCFDDGYIKLSFAEGDYNSINGTFIIARAKVSDIFNWEILKYVDLLNLPIRNFNYLDFTIEQGVEYIYSIQQYNTFGVTSNRILSNIVYADFEDMFLFDGQRQLKVRYNPKVSTYKSDILDTKTDTIGSKYPFIVRNGYVNYKEFNLSGLLSFNIDDSKLFMLDEKDDEEQLRKYTPEESFGAKTYTNLDLVSQNIFEERKFKNKVLTWLADGKPKMLRTATEGNYVVRLMNVAASPEDKLGRMIHNFSCVAYEIGESNIEGLKALGILEVTDARVASLKQHFKSFILRDYYNSSSIDTSWVSIPFGGESNVNFLKFTDMIPGSKIRINGTEIMIGATGTYYYKPLEPIISIEITNASLTNGSFEMNYLTKEIPQYTYSIFDMLQQAELITHPLRQYVGKVEDLFATINDARTELIYTKFIRFYKRPIYDLYIKLDYIYDEKGKVIGIKRIGEEDYYEDMNCLDPFTNFEDFALYRIRGKLPQYIGYVDYTNLTSIYEGYYLDAMKDTVAPYFVKNDLDEDGNISKTYQLLINGKNPREEIPFDINIFNFTINGNTVNLYESDNFEIKSNILTGEISAKEGVITEISYLVLAKNYHFPKAITDTINLIDRDSGMPTTLEKLWAKYQTAFDNYLNDYTNYDNTRVKDCYNQYINALNKALVYYKDEYGIIDKEGGV